MTAKLKSIAEFNPEIEADKGHEFEVMAGAEPTGLFLSVVGKESTIYKGVIRRQINEARQAEFKRQRDGKPEQPQTMEQQIEKSIEAYAACVVAWRGNTVLAAGEAPAEFSPENVKRLLAYDFVRIQAEGEILGRGDFMPG